MLKDIFYIVEEEMCNKCWNQLAQAIKEVKNNNPQEINNLMFFKYYLKDQITALASKVIIIIKCNNNFYTLFWKQDLLKSEINSDNVESEYLPQGLILNEQIVNDVILSLKDKNNQHYNLNDNKNLNVLSNNNSVLFDDNMLGSFLPIPISNAEVIQITNVKRKSKHWLWILVIISVLLLTSGIGVIGYEMHRQSSHSNLVNSKIIVRDDNPVGEVKDENKDFILEDNNFDEQINEQSKDIILEENNLLDEVKD